MICVLLSMFQLTCSHLQGVHRKQSKLFMHQMNTPYSDCLMHMQICCCIQNFSADLKTKKLGCKKKKNY